MTTWNFFTSGWDWKPSVLIGCAALLILRTAVTKEQRFRRLIPFAAGVILLLLVLVSPLDELADHYLFSMHMLKHMLMVLIIPVLLLSGIPAGATRQALSRPVICEAERILSAPALAWTIGIAAMAVWHIPAIFNAALASEPVHIAEHLSLLIAGVIFWWPIWSPLKEERLSPVPAAVIYLFSACAACTLIGVLLTFAAPGTYGIPSQAALDPRVLSLVRNSWGVSPATDQQMAGLLMWVPGCLVYLSTIMLMFARWYSSRADGFEGEVA